MEERKIEHIELTQHAQIEKGDVDSRFSYEPIIASFSGEERIYPFLGKQLRAPIWMSSMTGGTEKAKKINQNLARLCAEFGLGMGLGSCRTLLNDNRYFEDFNLRKIIGYDLPFYANIGICQLEQLLIDNQQEKIVRLVDKLQADGIIIHVNPLQEILQKEGDRLKTSPLRLIAYLLEKTACKVIVKEVGQGFGTESIEALLQLPLQAVELAGFGGTNFAKLESIRYDDKRADYLQPLVYVGHTAEQMIDTINRILTEKATLSCNEIIISGGIRHFLDGYYLMQKCKLPSIYGQAATLLQYASDYKELRNYMSSQIEGLKIATTYLRIKENKE